ncbi:MAG: hypothetical protein KAS72_13085 [Phycisphaerales bacterium]|nr:hypothetical protein [Phycisphaerales bacterium]
MKSDHRNRISRSGLWLAASAALLGGCAAPEPGGGPAVEATELAPIVVMEQAHGKAVWDQLSVISYGTDLQFGDLAIGSTTDLELGPWRITERVTSPFQATIRSAGGLIEVADGEISEGYPTEFMVNTWARFFAAPFWMSDPGASHEYLGRVEIDGYPYDAVRITFENDPSEAWYICYITAPENEVGGGHLAMLRYTVICFGTPDAEGLEEHVAVYHQLEDVDVAGGRIIIPQVVSFHRWVGAYEDVGAGGQPNMDEELGEVLYTLLGTE